MSKKRVQVPQRALEWGWVGTVARDAAEITPDLRLRTCGLAAANKWPICPNSFADDAPDDGDERAKKRPRLDASGDEQREPEHECSKKVCKANPNCLNWLGQDEWEDGGSARQKFMRVNNLGRDPSHNKGEQDTPVGLKNLGATCYANALLQLWFQHLAFRDGVYRCRPSTENVETSPVFQLQMTFAGLQCSTQKAYDPVRLAECLGLKAAVQQDAQEFAKLFLDLLDQQFRLQEVESLKTLVPDQFEGTRMYANVCSNCGTRSERPDVFHEIVIDLKPGCKLETQLAEQLRAEELTGDNRYHCSACDSLQDARRFTELRDVPPVLHFTMARFVWDETGDRKKCKDAIQFPLGIDMGRFVNEGKAGWYDLRGILLHKGASAHHGHYESQVLDAASGRWFNFNDDEVSEIDLGAQVKTGKDAEGAAKPAAKRSARATVVPDSDDDDIQIIDKLPMTNKAGYISSREAYMIVYARRDEPPPSSPDKTMQVDEAAPVTIPDPQVQVLSAIEDMNKKFADECAAFKQRRETLIARFRELRDAKRDIYRSWNVSRLSDRSVIVSRTALSEWLERGLAKRKRAGSDATLDGAAATDTDGTVWDGMDLDVDAKQKLAPSSADVIENTDIECWHGRLDPAKAGEMKRISEAAYEKIVERTNCAFQPVFTTSDVCEDCVESSFLEKYYAQAHPNLVEQFDEFCKESCDEPGSVWISKGWVKDWKYKNPKMHRPGHDDPPPDSDDFAFDVKCEHGRLGTNVAGRRRIPAKAAELLQTVFMTWKPVACDEEECAICQVERSTSMADRRQRQIEAENEKQQLKELCIAENRLAEEPTDNNQRYAIVPAAFMRAWYQWLRKPVDNARPVTVDCQGLVCQHDLLCVDPNKRGDRTTLRFIKDTDFHKLVELRDGAGGPLLQARGVGVSTPMRLELDRDVCEDCRTERLSNYENGEVTVSILNDDEPLPNPDAYELSRADTPPMPSTGKQGNGMRRYGLRQTTRRKQRKEWVVTIQRHNLIKTVKAEVYHESKIFASRQRLFLRGVELTDEWTVSEAGILPGDVLECYEVQVDAASPPSRRDEGFSGTLLSGGATKPPSAPQTVPDASSSPILTYGPEVSDVHPAPSAEEPSQVSCTECTLLNDPTNSHCAACDSVLPT